MPEYLDPEIANEGEAATMWHPGAGPAPIPDMQKMLGNHKHYGRYFAPKVFAPFPSYIYHATEGSKVVKTAKEAKEYGISYLIDPGGNHYVSTGEWKTYPIGKQKPNTSGAGKSVITAERAQGGASLDIMAQILQQMQKGQVAPPALNEAVKADPDYAAFVEFKKWKEAQNVPAITPLKRFDVLEIISASPMTARMPDENQKEILIDLANERGIKLDKRWGLDKIKAALDEAGEV